MYSYKDLGPEARNRLVRTPTMSSRRRMIMEKKYAIHEIEEQSLPGTYGMQARLHLAKFWRIYTISATLVLMVIVLCVVYVGMPRLVQKNVDESHLEFTDIQFLSPGSNSIYLKQKAILYNPSKFTPTLNSFTADIYIVTNGTYATTPLTSIVFPETHALHPSTAAGVDQRIEFASQAAIEEVAKYSAQIMSQLNITIAIVGQTKLRLGALPATTVTYNQTMTHPGLNGLNGFNVTNAKLNLAAPVSEPNLVGLAYLPNPSFLTVELGNITMEMATAEAGVVGEVSIQNMSIVPGVNMFPMSGRINQTRILHSMNAATGIVTLLITGKEAVYNGTRLTYYENALKSNTLSLPMNVPAVLANSGLRHP